MQRAWDKLRAAGEALVEAKRAVGDALAGGFSLHLAYYDDKIKCQLAANIRLRDEIARQFKPHIS